MITIEKFHLKAFDERMIKLGHIARRLGVSAPTFKVVREFTRGVDETLQKIAYVEIEIIGSAPKIDGWTYITRFDHVNGIATGEETKEGYSVDVCKCEHCGQNRMRNTTYLITNEAGDIKQVGGSCLRHYLGHVLPVNLDSYYSSLSEIGDFNPSGRMMFELAGAIRVAAHIIDVFGYEKGKTKGRVSEILTGFNKEIDWNYIYTKYDDEYVNNIINTVRSLPPVNDYNRNLINLTKYELFEPAYLGFVCSMLPTTTRVINSKIQTKQESATSEYVGVVGVRTKNQTLSVTKVANFESNFGWKTLIRFVDEAGNILVWWASGYFVEEEILGKTFSVTYTVKSHEQYKGVNQTTITRAKMVEMCQNS